MRLPGEDSELEGCGKGRWGRPELDTGRESIVDGMIPWLAFVFMVPLFKKVDIIVDRDVHSDPT